MAHFNRIEKLPLDALREIMTRVGQQPGGAADIARTITVSKTLRNFVDDGDVLRSISFKDSLPCFFLHYDLLSVLGGLVVRCARARNSSAQFLLSRVTYFLKRLINPSMIFMKSLMKFQILVTKHYLSPQVVLMESSTLCCAKIEASVGGLHSTDATRNCNLASLQKATRLLDHFDPEEILDIIRTFLSQAEVEDIVGMESHLRNFVALFLVHGKKPLLQQFLDTLDELCGKSSFPLLRSNPLFVLINKFNEVCIVGHNLMGNIIIDEVVYDLLEYLVETNDDVVYETLLESLDIVQPLLKVGAQMMSTRKNKRAVLANSCNLRLAAVLRKHLMLLIEHKASTQSAHRKLLASYNAIFDAASSSVSFG
ncbi:hypothetical protein KSS87_008899 [Heliosperma pusillum]|nr:hypothetical protein KSS87_008899 [Heliosperma pusillum]